MILNEKEGALSRINLVEIRPVIKNVKSAEKVQNKQNDFNIKNCMPIKIKLNKLPIEHTVINKNSDEPFCRLNKRDNIITMLKKITPKYDVGMVKIEP